MVVYGPAGVGKTTLASSAQDSTYGKDVFFIDIEAGTRSISDRGDITVFKPNDWLDISGVYKYLSEEKHGFRTVVIDSLTEAQRYSLEYAMRSAKNPEFPGLQDYGKSNEQLVRLVRSFKALSQTKGYTIIFTALEREDKDENTGVVSIGPALSPKAQEGVCGAVDCVARLTVNREGERVLQLAPRGATIAKFRAPITGVRLPDEMKSPNMRIILANLRGEAVAA